MSLDELEDNNKIFDFFKSNEFKENFSKAIEEFTWDKGLPMIYMNEDGYIVKHWKDGKIEKINTTNETIKWDEIFKEVDEILKIELPIRLKMWLKNKFNPPTKK
jgi:desulfoferrodoxin (superoxide reductase-like protein)